MSSQTLKFLAFAMIIGSVVLAFIALRISRAPQNTPAMAETAAVPPKELAPRIVVAARPIPPGEEIGDADLALASVDPAPSEAFQNPEDVVGRRPLKAIGAGSPVRHSHFVTGNPLAEMLREDERAVAVKVNDLIGVGGFLRPGDKVDVLLYFRGDRPRSQESQSLVVVRAVRVLAYGSELARVEEISQNEKIKSKDAGTAVLAVGAQDAVRLALAENAGVLRLALRPALIDGEGSEDDGDSVRLSEITVPAPREPAPKERRGPVVEVYRGGQKSTIQFP
jgi:pilus assembly protein CpaB